jgi:Domain of unknown function (DUF1844)
MSDDENKGFKVTDRRIDFEDGEGSEPAPADPPTEEADDAAAADADADVDAQAAAADDGPASTTDDAPTGAADEETGPPPVPMSFSTLLLSLGTSALAALGDVPESIAGQPPQKNLPMARQTIDILGILEEKTKGNLTEEEQTLLRNLLYDLRVRYVQAESAGG